VGGLDRHMPSVTATITAHTTQQQILELGAGCGLLGLTLARNLSLAAEVCLTEQAHGGALEHLRRNVERNAAAGMPGMNAVTTAACDWTQLQGDGGPAGAGGSQQAAAGLGARGQQEADDDGDGSSDNSGGEDMARLLATKWDVIVGSDLVSSRGGMVWMFAGRCSLCGLPPPPSTPWPCVHF